MVSESRLPSSTSRFLVHLLVLTILVGVCCSTALAQLSSATLTGVVRDNSGAVVPNATVALKHLATNVERKTTTNTVGNYSFQNVPPGAYTLVTTASGFRPNRVAEFELVVNQSMTQDTVLEVGSLEQAVEVTAAAEQLQASTSELGAVIEQKSVHDLPLNGRNFTALLQLTPGASPISVSQNSAQNTPRHHCIDVLRNSAM